MLRSWNLKRVKLVSDIVPLTPQPCQPLSFSFENWYMYIICRLWRGKANYVIEALVSIKKKNTEKSEEHSCTQHIFPETTPSAKNVNEWLWLKMVQSIKHSVKECAPPSLCLLQICHSSKLNNCMWPLGTQKNPAAFLWCTLFLLKFLLSFNSISGKNINSQHVLTNIRLLHQWSIALPKTTRGCQAHKHIVLRRTTCGCYGVLTSPKNLETEHNLGLVKVG